MQRTEHSVFEVAFIRYRNALRVFFERRTSSTVEAEDLVQDVYVRLAAQRDPAAIQNPEAFLFTIARNLVRDHYRALKVQQSVLDPVDPASLDPADGIDPSQAVIAREELRLVLHAFEVMEPLTRTVFILHRFERIPYRVLGDRLGLTINQVRTHIARATHQIWKELETGNPQKRPEPRRKEYGGTGG